MKILVVDDNAENIDMMSIMLKSQNYEVQSAHNGKEALEKLLSDKYDIIISDILMPVMDGFQLCRACKKDSRLKNIYFIFYTATYIDEKDEEFALSIGARKFIRKPQEPETFLNIIKEVIEKSEANDELSKSYIEQDEKEVLKLYSQRLVEKLEKKNLDLKNEIASHKRKEKKLIESKERLALAVEGTMDGLWDWNVLTDHIYHSDRYASMLGYKSDELPNTSEIWSDLMHPDDKEAALRKVEDCLAKKDKYYESTFRMKTKDGSYKWIYARGKALYDKKGKPYRFVGFHTDITEKKEADEALRESEERFRFVFEYSSIGKFLTAPDGKLIRVNYAFANMLGYSIEEIQQLNFAEIYYPDDRVKYEECMRCLLASEQDQYRMENRYFHKNGKIIWVDESTSLLRNISGNPKYFITNVMDITDKKKWELELIEAKEKAEESDKLKTAFLANISHEVRTPMNGIMGFINLLTRPQLESCKKEQYLEIIDRSCNQLLTIITTIVEMSKLDAKQISVNNGNVNISSLINDLYPTYSQKLSTNQNVRINTSVHSSVEECICYTDEGKLTQILINLIDNAIECTSAGTIDIGCRLNNSNEIEFLIKDTGTGIAKEHHEVIFEKFRQIEITPALQSGGMGLGLSLSKAHVQLLGGRIWLESEPGEGSVFYFTIPYVPVTIDDQPSKISHHQNNTLSGKVVLIAEDDDNNYAYLEEILKENKVKVVRANNGKMAVELCKTNPEIELVLMDIKMPVMNGYEATKQILNVKKNIPIIAQTAYVFEDDKQKAMDSGCVDYILKPIKNEKLIAVLNKHLK